MSSTSNQKTHSGRRRLSGLAGPLSAAMTALLIVTGCTADKPQPPTPPSRILQSVSVQMTPDGTMTAVNGTAVSVRGNASDATTENTTYSPRQVAGDLPVRVSTSYRTDKKTGTKLDDLNGYTGRVEIDLTVQNLTVKPQNLKYDVAGTSRTQPAMVGAPLTIVASTSLPDIKPTDVVTATAPGQSDATNGVLSQSEKGGSVVQWATLLAAPQTGTAATLRLVSDVKDFKVPTIDLSVEPGLVTDPSVSGVIDSAFNSDPTSQLALEQRTIKVITDANQVLTRAGDNISSVRKNLDSTSKTLGARTTEELKTSTQSVSTSMKGLDQELKSLNSDISGTLGETQSSVLQELGQTVGAMDQMLGDTSATPPTPVIDGNGCKTVVKDPKNAGTVYGNLMEVTAQLDGYSTATGRCKREAQQVLLRSVGPKKPNAEICKGNASTTCSLYYTEQNFSSIMQDLVKKGDALVGELQPTVITDARDDFDALSKGITDAQGLFATLDQYDPYQDLDANLADVDKELKSGENDDDLWDRVAALSDEVEAVRSTFGDIHDQADNAYDCIAGDGEANDAAPRAECGLNDGDSSSITGLLKPGHTLSMLQQNQQLADQICQYQNDKGGVLGNGSGLTQDQARTLRSYLVDDSCPGDTDNDGNPINLDDYRKKQGVDAPMQTRLQDQADRWKKIADLTNVKDPNSAAYQNLQALRDQINTVQNQIDVVQGRVQTVKDTKDTDAKKLSQLMAPLRSALAALDGKRDKVDKDVTAVAKWQAELKPTITNAFQDAADQANDQVSKAVNPQIRKVTDQAVVDSQAVGDMFDQSAAGLSSASDQISRNGTRTIEAQRRQLQASEKGAERAASKQVDQALTQMATGVSASTKDMNGASAQLTNSLNNVLLDLGTRKVNGSGLLGSMTTSAAKVGTADYQLALASTTTTSYAGVRNEDVNGILLRQAQLSAALEAGAHLPAFHLNVPSGAQSQTVYSFEIKERK